MRITGGTLRGRIIKAPGGLATRPTGSKARQAFFNILGQNLTESRFLDLFSGSGVMGLEAISRGAVSVTFVEQSRKLTRAIEDSLETFGVSAQVITGDARKILNELGPDSFDIVFADPPYASRLALSCLNLISRNRLVRQAGILAIEHARQLDLPESLPNLSFYDRREYGQTVISFFQAKSTEID